MINLQIAQSRDLAGVIGLFADIYGGQYPDETVSNYAKLLSFTQGLEKFIAIAKDPEHERLLGCVFFHYDPENLLVKVSAGVVRPEARGDNLTKQLIAFGREHLQQQGREIDITFATTRTVHTAAQRLTSSMGFVKLGLFPNAHKTNEFETHGLAAHFHPRGLAKRDTALQLHPGIFDLYELTRQEYDFGPLEKAELNIRHDYDLNIPPLEVIEAPLFVAHLYAEKAQRECIDFAFYPFYRPNFLITSAAQDIEVYCSMNKDDGHCAIIGILLKNRYSLVEVFKRVKILLRDRGARYVELITQARRVKVVNSILESGFIPCGYFPALQQVGDKRHDYVVFSKTFEIFDFSSVELDGINKQYLQFYFERWKEKALNPRLMDPASP